MFSGIVNQFHGLTNALYRERNTLLARGEKVIDLISGSPYGIPYPESILSSALKTAGRKARGYHPDPLGQKVARKAISRFYEEEGILVPPDHVVLTPGTSISYWYAFQLFADSNDEILCPKPTYPLFDSIATLCKIKLVHYPLCEKERWTIDLHHLESMITPKSRAIILISPHNPTGAVASDVEVEGLVALAARYHLPIISDEVFSPFLLQRDTFARPAAFNAPLVVMLNGFSKMFCLPGLKVGWMALTGQKPLVRKAMEALEGISDTFLPVSEISQYAIPAIFKGGRPFLKEYRLQIRRRADRARRLLSKTLSFVPPEGGFYMTSRINHVDEEEAVIGLLRNERLLVHPGFFYDMASPHIVFNFTLQPNQLTEGLRKMARYFGKR